jgi:ankyrin repeat protein
VAKLLLTTNGVDVGSKDNDGYTPLFLAVGVGHDGVVKLLLESGRVDVNSRKYKGHMALLVAACNGRVDGEAVTGERTSGSQS